MSQSKEQHFSQDKKDSRQVEAIFKEAQARPQFLNNENESELSIKQVIMGDNIATAQDNGIVITGQVQGNFILNKRHPNSTPQKVTGSFRLSTKKLLGRAEELIAIHERLQQNNLLFISGVGGIGKTTLALIYVQQYQDQYPCRHRINYASSLKESFVSHFNHLQGYEFKGDLDIIYDKICSALANNSERTLLVIDNYDNDSEANHLASLLPSNCVVLITSRLQLNDWETLRIGPLLQSTTEALFYQHYGYSPKDDGALHVLLRRIGYHTLTTELLAKTARNGELTITDLLDIWQQEGLTAEDLALNIDTPYEKAEQDAQRLRKILLAAFKLTNIQNNPDELQLLRQFSVLPANELSRDDLMPWLKLEKRNQLLNPLNALVRKGWINSIGHDQSKTYQIHPVVQEVIQERESENLWESTQTIFSVFWEDSEKIFAQGDKAFFANLDLINQSTYFAQTLWKHEFQRLLAQNQEQRLATQTYLNFTDFALLLNEMLDHLGDHSLAIKLGEFAVKLLEYFVFHFQEEMKHRQRLGRAYNYVANSYLANSYQTESQAEINFFKGIDYVLAGINLLRGEGPSNENNQLKLVLSKDLEISIDGEIVPIKHPNRINMSITHANLLLRGLDLVPDDSTSMIEALGERIFVILEPKIKDLPEPKYHIQLRRLKGKYFYVMEKYEEAIEEFKAFEQLLKAQEANGFIFQEIYKFLALVSTKLGDHQNAEMYLQKAYQVLNDYDVSDNYRQELNEISKELKNSF